MKKRIALAALALLTLVACKQEGGKFHIVGQITEADDTTLYLEHMTVDHGPVAIDSVKLDAEGRFDFAGDTIGNPEFYRLRIGEQIVNLSVDSTETITVRASLPKMAVGYTVEGSGSCDTIRMLTLKLDTLTRAIRRTVDDRTRTLEERDAAIQALIADYKTDVKINFVQNFYHLPSSYYALFQVLAGRLLFDPVADAKDVTWFTAIANAWLERYPGSLRTQNLCNIAMQGHKNTRQRGLSINLDDEKVQETGIIDMGFPDISGQERRLSELKGSVVMLDFTALSLKGSQERTIALRELYNKYHAQGLEIYQVSLDPDEHQWKTLAHNLPWITVWNREGMANDIVQIYNLQQVPTWFLIDRGNNLVGRMELMGDVEQEIKKLL
ncbi:MAG: redoxin domain-containing protein [Bacteroidaceae bacterium]|nr:redoxin domain-containing protein [Bacteroidaceae bacterium]